MRTSSTLHRRRLLAATALVCILPCCHSPRRTGAWPDWSSRVYVLALLLDVIALGPRRSHDVTAFSAPTRSRRHEFSVTSGVPAAGAASPTPRHQRRGHPRGRPLAPRATGVRLHPTSCGAPRRHECSGGGGEGPAGGGEADRLDPAALLMGPGGQTGEVALGELRIDRCHREQRLPQRQLALDTQR